MKKILFLLLLTSFFKLTNAQSNRIDYDRYSFWTESVLNGPIIGKIKWQLDYQYRRCSEQSNLSDNKNPFKNNSQNVYRPWITYQLNDNVKFAISPIGFWETYSSELENNGVKKIQPEFRICPQLTLSNKINRISIDQRYRIEYRILGIKQEYGSGMSYLSNADFPLSNIKWRGRYMVRATIPLGLHKKIENNTFYVVAWNELFISFGENVSDNKIWDQNRTFCLMGYKPIMSLPMRFELGYGLQIANRYTTTIDYVEKNHILQVYVIFEDFNKIFKNK